MIPLFGFCHCRQEEERLTWRSGGSRKKSNVSQDASAYNRRLKLWSDNTLCELRAMHTFANVSLACVYADICPEDIPPSEGLGALNTLFEAKMGHGVAKFLDTLFDFLVN